MSTNYFGSTMKITGEKRKNTKGSKILSLSEINRMKNIAFNQNQNKNRENILQISGKSILKPNNKRQRLKGNLYKDLYDNIIKKNYQIQELRIGQILLI